jgi:excisionase family DNA binding protein
MHLEPLIRLPNFVRFGTPERPYTLFMSKNVYIPTHRERSEKWYILPIMFGTMRESVRRELMDFRTRQLKRALEPLVEALESHHRSLEELESALIEFEEALVGREESPERPQAQPGAEAAAGGHLDLLSITDVCQELGMGKSWVYRRIQSGEIPSVKLGRNIKVRREDLEGYLEAQRYNPTTSGPALGER